MCSDVVHLQLFDRRKLVVPAFGSKPLPSYLLSINICEELITHNNSLPATQSPVVIPPNHGQHRSVMTLLRSPHHNPDALIAVLGSGLAVEFAEVSGSRRVRGLFNYSSNPLLKPRPSAPMVMRRMNATVALPVTPVEQPPDLATTCSTAITSLHDVPVVISALGTNVPRESIGLFDVYTAPGSFVGVGGKVSCLDAHPSSAVIVGGGEDELVMISPVGGCEADAVSSGHTVGGDGGGERDDVDVSDDELL